MSTDWKLTGTYFEACNCDAVCPCVFLSDPTEDECTVLVGWHIEDGVLDGLALNGLNVALAYHAPGNMAQVPWSAAIYLDDSASPEQSQALMQIFTGQVGGHPGMLVSHVGEVLGIKSVPIRYVAEGKARSLQIEGIAEVEVEAMPGHGGQGIRVENHILCIAPGYPATVAKSSKLSYRDHGQQWEIGGKTGLFSPFTYQGG